MIATLEGTVSEKIGDVVVVTVTGIGYGVLVSSSDFGALESGTSCKLYIHEHIREEAHDLFGFSSFGSLQLFQKLLSVNGVGPKMALNILNVGSHDQIKSALSRGDVTYLQSASGVGKRLAQRMIIDLKDKVGTSVLNDNLDFIDESHEQDEAVQALTALGYTLQDAKDALQGINAKLSVEQRVREALKEAKNGS